MYCYIFWVKNVFLMLGLVEVKQMRKLKGDLLCISLFSVIYV